LITQLSQLGARMSYVGHNGNLEDAAIDPRHFRERGFQTGGESPDLPERARVKLIVELVEAGSPTQQQMNALTALEDLWRQAKIHSHGERLTRDQFHDYMNCSK